MNARRTRKPLLARDGRLAHAVLVRAVLVSAVLVGAALVVPSVARGDPQFYYLLTQSSVAFKVGDPSSGTRIGTTTSGLVLAGVASSHLQSGDEGHYTYNTIEHPLDQTHVDTSALGDTDGTAAYGKLTAHASGGMSLDVNGTAALPQDVSYNSLSALTSSKFLEAITYTTSNPNGLNVKFEISLDSSVSASGGFLPGVINDGGFNAYANSFLVIRRSPYSSDYVGISAVDSTQRNFGHETVKEHILYQATTVHIDPGAPVTLYLQGELDAGVGGSDATATMEAQASHTALFAVSSDDPLAQYTSLSGAVYATSVPKPLAGDANFDSHVNFDDLVILAQHYNQTTGQSWSTGDFNTDAAVNFDDLVILAQHYNTSAVSGEMSPAFAADWALAQSLVPEPSAALAIATGFLALRRRRR